MTEQKQDEPRVFEITTTAQVERTYRVHGADEKQAHDRLRTYLKDPEMVQQHLVSEMSERQSDSTPQRVNDVKEVTKPRAVEPEKEKGGKAKSA